MDIGTSFLLPLLRLPPPTRLLEPLPSNWHVRLAQRTAVFYTTQEIDVHFLKDPELTTPRMPTVSAAATAVGIERPASVPPILKNEGDMMTVEAEVEASARANWKRKRDQLVWDYCDETGGGDGGGGGEGVSEEEVVLSADERKCARIGHGAIGARRRSLGDDERRPGSMVRGKKLLV